MGGGGCRGRQLRSRLVDVERDSFHAAPCPPRPRSLPPAEGHHGKHRRHGDKKHDSFSRHNQLRFIGGNATATKRIHAEDGAPVSSIISTLNHGHTIESNDIHPTASPPPPGEGTGRRRASLRSVALSGPDHTELGTTSVHELTPNLAVGISRGRFPKGYPHVDPNEDAVFAATDGSTSVLCVVDGHSGFDAAGAAIAAISEAAPQILDQNPDSIVADLSLLAAQAVATNVPSLAPPRERSETAVTIVALREAALASSTAGDTACFVVEGRRVNRIGGATEFLTPSSGSDAVATMTATPSERSTVVVLSDGIIDFAGDTTRALRSIRDLSARDAVDRLLALAFQGGAGDNLSVAVFTQSK